MPCINWGQPLPRLVQPRRIQFGHWLCSPRINGPRHEMPPIRRLHLPPRQATAIRSTMPHWLAPAYIWPAESLPSPASNWRPSSLSRARPSLFEARLTLGEIGLKSVQAAIARAQLTSLERQAREKHFLLVARKAKAL